MIIKGSIPPESVSVLTGGIVNFHVQSTLPNLHLRSSTGVTWVAGTYKVTLEVKQEFMEY